MIDNVFTRFEFNDQEKSQIVDNRAYRIALLAAKYLELQEKDLSKKEVKKIPKSVKSKRAGAKEEQKSMAELFYPDL